MTRHERFAAYAGELHCEDYEIPTPNGIAMLPVIFQIGEDEGYHTARLLGAWIGDMWLDRTFFALAQGDAHIERVEGLIADAMDAGKMPHEPSDGPKSA